MPRTTIQIQADLDQLDAALATGATRVSYSTGSVEYRSYADMLRARDRLSAQLGQALPVRRTVATFNGGFY